MSTLDLIRSVFILWVGYGLSIYLFGRYTRKLSKLQARGIRMGRNLKFLYRFWVIFPVAITAALRAKDVGADTDDVMLSYLRISMMDFTEMLFYDPTAILFSFFRWIVGKVTWGNIQIYLFLVTFITIYIVLLSIEKWELKYSAVALFAFYCCNGPNLMNQSRQLLAVAILLYAYWYAHHHDIKKFLFLSLLAGLFHLSGFFCALIIYAILPKKKYDWKNYVFLIALGVFMVAADSIIALFGNFFGGTKYEYIFEELGSASFGFGFILALIPTAIPAVLFRKYLDRENRLRNVLLLCVPARLAGYYSYFLYRLCHYFAAVNVIALPVIIENAPARNRLLVKYSIYAICIFYFVLFYCVAYTDVYFPYHIFTGF